MNTRERRPEERLAGAPQGSNASGTTGDSDLSQRAEDLLAAGDQAIEQALSGDSSRFLSHQRQAGGQ